MHLEAMDEIKKFIIKYDINEKLMVAELGSYNINGSVKEVIPYSHGFDILSGKGVDNVIEPGKILEQYKHKYDILISTSSFQTCPDSNLYKQEILDLCKNNALVFLTMCSLDCKYQHSTSPNQYNFKDEIRMSEKQLINFMAPEIEMIDCYIVKYNHSTIIFIGEIHC